MFNGAGDEFAIEGLADEDGDAHIAEAVGGHKQRTMPKGEDSWWGDEVSGGDSGVTDVFKAQRHTQQPDGRRGEDRHDCEQDTLLPIEGLWHEHYSMRSILVSLGIPLLRFGRMTDVES